MKNKHNQIYQADFNISGFNVPFHFCNELLEQITHGINWVHKHGETEIQIGKSGTRTFIIQNKEYVVGPGDVLVVPPNTLHYAKTDMSDTDVRSFMIEIPTETPVHFHLDDFICNEFFKSIDEYLETGNLFSMIALLPFICIHFIDKPVITATGTKNPKVLINSFMANNFHSDITLNDLAEHLHLSPRQTSRIINKYYGTSFKQLLNELRAQITLNMLASKKSTITKISEDVLDYQSYSSFKKMYLKNIKKIDGIEIFKILEKQLRVSDNSESKEES